jgi:hypothetical protein
MMTADVVNKPTSATVRIACMSFIALPRRDLERGV